MLKYRIISWFVIAYLLLIRLTCRVRYIDKHGNRVPLATYPQAIFAIWHGRLLYTPVLFNQKQFTQKSCSLSSAHKDGYIITFTSKFFGHDCVFGSSTRGGAKAFRQLIKHAKNGYTIFFTPDGPKGPRGQAKEGTVELARMTGLPLIPLAISASKAKQLNNWDKFQIIRPFTTIYISFGDAITLPREANDATRQAAHQALEYKLTQLEEQVDTCANP